MSNLHEENVEIWNQTDIPWLIDFKKLFYKWELINTSKSFGKKNKVLSCNSFWDSELGNIDKNQQYIDVKDHQESIKPDNLDTKLNKDSLFTELE